jgi:hypothetical protein
MKSGGGQRAAIAPRRFYHTRWTCYRSGIRYGMNRVMLDVVARSWQRMISVSCCFAAAVSILAAATGPKIPSDLWGTWKIVRIIPTTTISCESRAKILGTELEYSADVFRWTDVIVSRPKAVTRIVRAAEFAHDNSGGGANDSHVTFKQLGIEAGQVELVRIAHPAGNITGGTIEIPGDQVLLEDRDTAILSVCNVYYEAKRIEAPH